MALAHERAGSRELAGEQLARAVEVSGKAPAGEPALRPLPACRTSGSARPRGWWSTRCAAPRTTARLLLELGQIHLARQDWARADQVAALLRKQDDPEAAGDGGEPRDREPARPGPHRRRGRSARGPRRARRRRRPGDGATWCRAMPTAGDLDAARRYLDGVLRQGSGERRRPAAAAPGSTSCAAIPPPPRPATAR